MNESIKSGYGRQIRHFREQKGLSQTDVARHFGISYQTVQQWESDDTVPRGKRLKDLADLLDCSVSDLLFGDGIDYIETTSSNPPAKQGSLIGEYKTTGDSYYTEVRKKIKKASRYTPNELHRPLPTEVPLKYWPSQRTAALDLLGTISCPVRCSALTTAYVVEGAAASPRFNEGDVVFVDAEKEPKAGNTVLYCLSDGRYVLRRLDIEGEQRYLTAINPDWPEKFYKATESDRLMGVVLGKWVEA